MVTRLTGVKQIAGVLHINILKLEYTILAN